MSIPSSGGASNNDGVTNVRLHILQLHESPVINGNDYSRFKWMWVIDDTAPPKTTSSCSTDNADNNSTGADPDYHISHGDLLFFPELQTGAGEFEGLRFAGRRQQSLDHDDNNNIPLLVPGVESLEFPKEIYEYVSNELAGVSLRRMYERPIQSLLSHDVSGGFSLSDIYGGQDVVEEMWNQPDILRPPRRKNDHHFEEENNRWVIPLSECALIRTECFDIMGGSTRR